MIIKFGKDHCVTQQPWQIMKEKKKNMPWKNFQTSTDTPMLSTKMKKFNPPKKPLQLNGCWNERKTQVFKINVYVKFLMLKKKKKNSGK